MDKLYASFRDAYHEFQQMTKKYDGLESEIGYVREDVAQKKTACEAFDKIMSIYRSQIDQVNKILNDAFLKKNQAISSSRLLVSTLMPMNTRQSPNKSDANDEEVEEMQKLMNSNRDKLKQRIEELQCRKEQLTADMEYLGTILAQLQEELDLLRPELIELRKKRENYHMWLLQRGENDDKIQAKLKGE